MIELSLKNWLVAGLVPGLVRHPLKRLEADRDALLRFLERWRMEALRGQFGSVTGEALRGQFQLRGQFT